MSATTSTEKSVGLLTKSLGPSHHRLVLRFPGSHPRFKWPRRTRCRPSICGRRMASVRADSERCCCWNAVFCGACSCPTRVNRCPRRPSTRCVRGCVRGESSLHSMEPRSTSGAPTRHRGSCRYVCDLNSRGWPAHNLHAAALGARLLFPGNVYNFGSGMPAVLGVRLPTIELLSTIRRLITPVRRPRL